jgi:hypothetical protein
VIHRTSFHRTFFLAACLAIVFLSACKQSQTTKTAFTRVPVIESNVNFNNTLTNSDDFNIIEYLYFYNGGGVAIGDVNNDGLSDIYFSSNQGSNKLYLNKGAFVFEDITKSAGVSGVGNWKTGVTMADVNGDGFLDIFVCGVGNYKKFDSRNQLLINNGDLTFSDKTAEYGLAFQGFSTQASFFDYDNDGDLDMYLVNHSVHTKRSYGRASLRFESDSLAGDKLYRNDMQPDGVMHFQEVTKEAGILNSHIGYGLGIGVSDLDGDGDPDLYVSNDFNENDYLYINQGDGTFVQTLESSVPHSSRFSMGNDIADINNDGMPDVLTLDMLPKSEQVIKTTAGEDPFEIYEFKLRYGYHYQVSRNALQLNRGLDERGELMFSDIAPLAGVEATDWSWAPLLADFNNDGYRDLFVANGIVGRPNDLDYINYISTDSAQHYFSDDQLIEQMPSGKVTNVFFRNRGDRTFEDVTIKWIGTEPGFSNGASYGDLDNDGDLDLVVNNVNDVAGIFRNDLPQDDMNYLAFELKGSNANTLGIGAKVLVYADGQAIMAEQMPVRGWLSSVDYRLHVGLGGSDQADSVTVTWPGGKTQTLISIPANQTVRLRQVDATQRRNPIKHSNGDPLLTDSGDVPFRHKENEFVAFNVERLIPQMLSTQGPKLAVGDINGDGNEDFFVGGAKGQPGSVLIQDVHGGFFNLSQPAIAMDSMAEDIDAELFDADGNGTLDLIVVGGGQEFKKNDKRLLPRLYSNDGKGNFELRTENIPSIFVNASCVRSADIDGDGDIDLFIGGRVVPGEYGMDPPSYVLINDGTGAFKDETSDILPGYDNTKKSLGMVTDARWVDVNQDGRTDLVVVGEWMPITVLLQGESGTFENRTEALSLGKTAGWWNTIEARDFDRDGDTDFIVGNLGLNSRLRASDLEPVHIYVGDIDGNNSLDQVLTYYNQGKSYPLLSRDQLIKQIPSLRRRFLKYDNYKDVTLDDIIDPVMQSGFVKKVANTFSSVYIENLGGKKFSIRNLPVDAQLFPIYAFCVDDINNDGNDDILAVGNLDATQPEFGRYDAGRGIVMLGDGRGYFKAMDSQQSGFVVRGQGRDIKLINLPQHRTLYLVARNNDTIKGFKVDGRSRE